MPVLEQLSLDEAFGEPAELAGATPVDRARFCEVLRAAASATTPAWSPRSAPGPASRSRRSRPGWPNRTASGCPPRRAARAVRGAAGAQAVGDRSRWPRRSCAGSAIETIGAFADLRTGGGRRPRRRRSAQRCIGSLVASTTARWPSVPKPSRSAPRRRSRTDLMTLGAAAAGGRVRSAARASPAAEGRPRRAHRDAQAEERDMTHVTRSVTLPYATVDRHHVDRGRARQRLLDPLEIGPIRLVGVGFSGSVRGSSGAAVS